MDRKSGFSIRFDKKFLESLIKNGEKGVVLEKCQHHIALHPAQLQDFKGALSDEVGRKIARYDKKFSGILLGFKNIAPVSVLGHIGSDNVFIHLDIEGEFFIFRPAIGMILNAVVTRTSKDHVGCLVYKTFNASLPKSAVTKEHENTWLGSKAKPGDQVSFEIVFLDLESRLPYIRGKILSIASNCEDTANQAKSGSNNKKITFDIETEEQQYEEQKSPKKKKKDKKKKEPEEAISTAEDQNGDLMDLHETVGKSKKKKKRKHSETELNDSYNLNTDEETPKKKKKRKNSESASTFNDVDTTLNSLENEEVQLNEKKKHKKDKTVKIEDQDNLTNEGMSKDILPKKKKHRKESISSATTSNSLNDIMNGDISHSSSNNDHQEYSQKKKKHKKDSTSQNSFNEAVESYTEEYSPKKKKHKKESANTLNETIDTSILKDNSEEYSSKKKKPKKEVTNNITATANNLEETIESVILHNVSNNDSGEYSLKKKKPKKEPVNIAASDNTLDETIECVISSSVLQNDSEDYSSKKKRLQPANDQNISHVDEAIETVLRDKNNGTKNEVQKSKQKLVKRRQSVAGDMVSSINSVKVNKRRLSVDSGSIDKTIDEVINRFCGESNKLAIKTLQEIKQEKIDEPALNLPKYKNNTFIDIEKEREALIKRAKEIKRAHTNSFSGGNNSDSSIEKIKNIKRESKTPAREKYPINKPKSFNINQNDSDSSIERLREKQKIIKREPKTPVRELVKKDSKALSVKKSKVNGIAGSMSDWEVEDFSRRTKVVKKPENIKIKKEAVTDVESDSERTEKKKHKKKRNSNSFSLNEGDLDGLFSSPSVKLEPMDTVKRKRKKSLSRSIDYKDIKLEQMSDIDDAETFSFSKNKSLSESGLHTNVDLGVKEDNEDILGELGIS